MFSFLVAFIALIGLLMTIAVLLQSGRGGGLAGIASGGATRQVLGSRQAPDTLEKATWTLATVFIVLCIVSTFFTGTEPRESVIQQRSQQGTQQQQEQQALPPSQGQPAPAPAPQQGGGSGSGGGGSQGGGR